MASSSVSATASASSRARIAAPYASRLGRIRSARESDASCRSTAPATAATSGSCHVMSTADPGLCSAWAMRSAATKAGFAVSSASTITSLGPAMESMPTVPNARRFAKATNRFPGPHTKSTGLIGPAPWANAATPCAPPVRHTSVTPNTRQVASRSTL